MDHRTRLVAMGAASNGVGTVHDIQYLCQAARKMSDGNAFTFVDVPWCCPGISKMGHIFFKGGDQT